LHAKKSVIKVSTWDEPCSRVVSC